MNRQKYSVAPFTVFSSFWTKRSLIWQMTKRDVIGRYRGSVMGMLWSLLNPILMLIVYTFVFSVVFQARWGEGSVSKTEFVMALNAPLGGKQASQVEALIKENV
ncbi:MAG: ABC transporter permease [Sulfuricaulis sp.]